MSTARVAAVEGSRRERMRAPVLTGLILTGLVWALHVRDPHQHASWGLCPSALLGLSCPGCGGLRAVNDLTRGDLGAAASSNLLLIVSMPVVVLALAAWTRGRWRGRAWAPPPEVSRLVLTAWTVLAVGFAVARNLPGSWLAP